MNDYSETHKSFVRFIKIIFLFLIVLMSVPLASAHGPKGHGEAKFTALQAAKKGLELYNKLVATGKLNTPWETDLKNIEVFPRQNGKKREIVVKFSRTKGEPNSVYIFFNEEGDYSGSNFTGK